MGKMAGYLRPIAPNTTTLIKRPCYNCFVGIILIVLVLVMGFLLYRKLIPAILALPLFALLIALVALTPSAFDAAGEASLGAANGSLPEGTPSFASPTIAAFAAYLKAYSPVLDVVVGQGMAMLAGAFLAVIIGAILAAHIRANGVAEQIVRFAAEFGGDSPLTLTLILTLVTAILFTTLGGLGAVIMVATLTLPVLRSVGVSGKTAAVSFLLALSLGGTLNPVNWQVYKDILGLEQQEIIKFAITMFGIFAAVTALYIAVKLAKNTRTKIMTVGVAIAALAIVAFVGILGYSAVVLPIVGTVFLVLITVSLIVLWLGAIFNLFTRVTSSAKPPLFAYFAIIVPLFHILGDTLARALIPAYAALGVTMPFLAALMLGVVYSFIASFKRNRANVDMLMRAMFEGFKDAAPAVLLMIGIGMLLKATMLPDTASAVSPILEFALPRSPVPYILVFTILAPLSLYRGPLNLWGMGSGIVGIVLGAGVLSAQHIMGAFFSVGMMQGVCDPTNTHNVWVGNNEGIEVVDLTKESILWVWIAVLAGLTAATFIFSW